MELTPTIDIFEVIALVVYALAVPGTFANFSDGWKTMVVSLSSSNPRETAVGVVDFLQAAIKLGLMAIPCGIASVLLAFVPFSLVGPMETVPPAVYAINIAIRLVLILVGIAVLLEAAVAYWRRRYLDTSLDGGLDTKTASSVLVVPVAADPDAHAAPPTPPAPESPA